MSSSRVLTHTTRRVAGDRAHGSLLPSRSSTLDIGEASGRGHAAVPQHHSSSRCPQGQSRSSHAMTGVFFTAEAAQGALRCRWLHGGVAAWVPVSPLGQAARGWGHQGAQAMGQGGDRQTDGQQQDSPAPQPTSSRTWGWGHVPLAAEHWGRVTCRTWWGHPTAPPGRAHGDGVAVRGAKGTLGGDTPNCPQGRPQIRTSPLPKPLSHSFTHYYFSSLPPHPTQGAKPQTPPKPLQQDPKHPPKPPSSPSEEGPLKSYLTAPTRKRKHQAFTQALSFYLMSQLSSSWSQLAQVPPSSSLSPWHSRGAVGTDPTRNKQWGLGCLGDHLGPPHPSHQADTGSQCWKTSRAL